MLHRVLVDRRVHASQWTLTSRPVGGDGVAQRAMSLDPATSGTASGRLRPGGGLTPVEAARWRAGGAPGDVRGVGGGRDRQGWRALDHAPQGVPRASAAGRRPHRAVVHGGPATETPNRRQAAARRDSCRTATVGVVVRPRLTQHARSCRNAVAARDLWPKHAPHSASVRHPVSSPRGWPRQSGATAVDLLGVWPGERRESLGSIRPQSQNVALQADDARDSPIADLLEEAVIATLRDKSEVFNDVGRNNAIERKLRTVPTDSRLDRATPRKTVTPLRMRDGPVSPLRPRHRPRRATARPRRGSERRTPASR